MSTIHKAFPLLTAVALCLLAAGTAVADPNCLQVQSRFSLEVVQCEAGTCAVGEYHGSLQGESEFTATSFGEIEAAPTMSLLTGENTIHTASGDIYTQDAIVLGAGGEFAEIDTVVGGTGDFEDASGRLVGTGTLSGAHGEGIVVGEICWP